MQANAEIVTQAMGITAARATAYAAASIAWEIGLCGPICCTSHDLIISKQESADLPLDAVAVLSDRAQHKTNRVISINA
jgi:hypothetical protein